MAALVTALGGVWVAREARKTAKERAVEIKRLEAEARAAESKAVKDEATSAQIMINTATKLANDLGKRLDDTNTVVSRLQIALASRDARITELETQLGQRDKHIAQLEAKVDLLIKLYGRDPFETKPGTGPLGKG